MRGRFAALWFVTLLAGITVSAQGRGGGGTPAPPGPMVLTFTSTPPDCYSGAGCLDPSFGMLGKVSVDVGGVLQATTATAVQPDGKIVVVGFTANATPQYDRRWVIGRFHADGSLDTDFGAAGLVHLDFDVALSSFDQARAVVIQPDGKILVAGHATLSASSIVIQLTASGSYDATFGTGGKAVFARGGILQTILRQPDGKILVLEGDGSATSFTVFRLTANGALDTSFGAGGFRQVYTLPSGGGYSLALQSTGGILIGGSRDSNFLLTRLTPSGAVDKKFGSQGSLVVDFFGQYDSISDIKVAADDSIVAVGRAATTSAIDSGQMAFARVTANGALSTSFGTGGRLAIDFGGFDWAREVIIQPDGRILFAGNSASVDGVTDIAVVGRVLSIGALDTSFGTGGIAMTSVQALTSWKAMSLDPDGLITLVGTSYASSSDVGSYRWLIGRYYR